MEKPGSARSKLSFALLSLFLVAIIFAAAGFFMKVALEPFNPSSTDKEIVFIERGVSPQSLTHLLESKRIIRDATLFYYLGKFKGSWARLKAGEYEVSAAMSPAQILDILTSGISVAHPFLIREGENVYEIASEIEAKGHGSKTEFLSLLKKPEFISRLGFSEPHPKTLEGYLFPDTYLFPRKISQEEIVRAMVKRFFSVWGEKEETRAKEIGMNRNEVVTLASVVEKETGAPQERPMIAGVFLNRLKKKMKLQSDPTIIYGIWERYDGNIHRSDILSPHAWNTYVVPALPATPIGNPGQASLQAVLHPAAHDFLYFVSQNDGTHVFSSTYEGHLKNVSKFQLDSAARTGKSWRDLGKSSKKEK